MLYIDHNSKKISNLAVISTGIVAVVIMTVFTWQNVVGRFSLSQVESFMAQAYSAWNYRLAYNWQSTAPHNPWDVHTVLAAAGLSVSGSTNTGTSIAESIPVLLYHGIAPGSDSTDVTTTQNFKDQMFALKNAGWHTITIEQFVAAMKGETTVTPKSFLLTFDDGRQDAYKNATPILQALGYQAIMYVITGHSLAPGSQNSKYYVTAGQLQEMLNSGVWELQSHGDIAHAQYPIDAQGKVGDFYGNRLWIPSQKENESDTDYQNRMSADLVTYFRTGVPWTLVNGREETTPEYNNRIETDLSTAKSLLENKMGIHVISFAYPYNDFAKDLQNDSSNGSPGLRNLVNKIYDVSFYQWYPSIGFSQDYPLIDGQLLKRIEPRPNWTPNYLLSVLAKGEPKSLPYTLNPNTDSWSVAWGTAATSSNPHSPLLLAATTTSTGALVILDGTPLWQNYDYKATITTSNTESISLIARFESNPTNETFAACNFGDGTVRLEYHTTQGVTIISRQNNTAIGLNTPASSPEIQVKDQYVTCLWNGISVTSGFLSTTDSIRGGIGIEIWNHIKDRARVSIQSLTVNNL